MPPDETLSPQAQATRRRNRWVLLGLAALFFLPVALSFVMYYGGIGFPSTRVNHGELIMPARPLPQVSLPVKLGAPADPAATADPSAAGQSSADPKAPPSWSSFKGKWSLVYVGDGQCEESCQQVLTLARQTRLGLNNEMTRVQRVFLVTAHCCELTYLREVHPGLIVLDATDPAVSPLLLAFPAKEAASSVYIVDPLGNLMMRYDARQNPRGLLQDLQKLLRLSHIG